MLLGKHLNMQMWKVLLDSNAAEQAARMAAMENATQKAKELIDELVLQRNRARQTQITTEISEIVISRFYRDYGRLQDIIAILA
ncbi:ATP synthase gamma chain [Geodia barretti]|uniref:ATP synthase gamma chain n=1 Tax=Geodia barretti TaxID=519541 RepID=A0AA35SNT9_GEOBA|nr:ATP synthase gamma chain [Geodia barretti]